MEELVTVINDESAKSLNAELAPTDTATLNSKDKHYLKCENTDEVMVDKPEDYNNMILIKEEIEEKMIKEELEYPNDSCIADVIKHPKEEGPLQSDIKKEMNLQELPLATECDETWRHQRSNFMKERRKNSIKPSGSDEDACHKPSPNASPQNAGMIVDTCEDCSNVNANLPKSKKPFVIKNHDKTRADEMDLFILNELKQMREQAVSQSDNDGDRQFLLSLLPMMKQLPPVDNMDIKIEIYEAFRRKMFKPPPSVQFR